MQSTNLQVDLLRHLSSFSQQAGQVFYTSQFEFATSFITFLVRYQAEIIWDHLGPLGRFGIVQYSFSILHYPFPFSLIHYLFNISKFHNTFSFHFQFIFSIIHCPLFFIHYSLYYSILIFILPVSITQYLLSFIH